MERNNFYFLSFLFNLNLFWGAIKNFRIREHLRDLFSHSNSMMIIH